MENKEHNNPPPEVLAAMAKMKPILAELQEVAKRHDIALVAFLSDGTASTEVVSCNTSWSALRCEDGKFRLAAREPAKVRTSLNCLFGINHGCHRWLEWAEPITNAVLAETGKLPKLTDCPLLVEFLDSPDAGTNP